MARPLAVVAALLLAFAGGAAAGASTRPSDLSCLHQWNLRANAANQRELRAARPFEELFLDAGTVSTVTWTKGSPPVRTTADGCLLSVNKNERTRVVFGRWRNGGVVRWSWGRWRPSTIVVPSNVTLLPGGRLKKIYR